MWVNLQLAFSILALGVLVAFATVGKLDLKAVFIFFATILGASCAYLIVFKALLRLKRASSDKMDKEIAEIERDVALLTILRAKEVAEALLLEEEKFKTAEASHGNDSRLGQFAPELKKFFTRFESVHSTYGDMTISRDRIGPSRYNPKFIRIGATTEHAEIAIMPGAEEVYEISGSDECEEDFASSPSIYHYLIREDRLVHG